MKLTPRGKASVDLEVWSIEKDRSYFREVFGRELSVARRKARAGCGGDAPAQRPGIAPHLDLRQRFLKLNHGFASLSLITRPRNSRKFGLCPTSSTESCARTFPASSENRRSWLRTQRVLKHQFAFVPISLPTSAAVCVARFSGLETMISTCTPSAARRGRCIRIVRCRLCRDRALRPSSRCLTVPGTGMAQEINKHSGDYSFPKTDRPIDGRPITAREERRGTAAGISSGVLVPSARLIRKSWALKAAAPRGGRLPLLSAIARGAGSGRPFAGILSSRCRRAMRPESHARHDRAAVGS